MKLSGCTRASQLTHSLIYVPAGRTAELQPLDVGINSVMKSKKAKFIREESVADPYRKSLPSSINKSRFDRSGQSEGICRALACSGLTRRTAAAVTQRTHSIPSTS
jgi:hypothetical protein